MFITRLYNLLECGKHKEIIDWSLDGTSFFVFNQEAMTRKILPVVYAQTHFSSFERQLNMYGFERLSDGRARKGQPSVSWFQHPFFIRGMPELLSLIHRKQRTPPSDNASGNQDANGNQNGRRRRRTSTRNNRIMRRLSCTPYNHTTMNDIYTNSNLFAASLTPPVAPMASSATLTPSSNTWMLPANAPLMPSFSLPPTFYNMPTPDAEDTSRELSSVHFVPASPPLSVASLQPSLPSTPGTMILSTPPFEHVSMDGHHTPNTLLPSDSGFDLNQFLTHLSLNVPLPSMTGEQPLLPAPAQTDLLKQFLNSSMLSS